MPESQLLDLIFRPGFSTVTEISDLSGRGIGLDAVNSHLQAMKGSIAVTTTPQQGTTFSLKIPLSLSTTKLLVCHARNYAYALPIEQIEQIITPAPNQLYLSSSKQLVLRWQQSSAEILVPVYILSELVRYSDLSDRLSSAINATPSSYRSHIAPTTPILLLQTIYGYRALIVDQVLGEQELVIRSLHPTITPPPYVYGCCTLGNSRSALAIDIEVLMQLTTEVEYLSPPSTPPSTSLSIAPPALPSTPSSNSASLPTFASDRFLPTSKKSNISSIVPRSSSPSSQLKTILVVDDSLTLRQQLTQVFQQIGYTVLQASDGLEALSHLRQQLHIDAVVCDIEMPNLNGFEFLSHVQRDPALAQTPIVVLTSRSSPKHRQIALELGAIAYFTKPYDSNQLITTIERLLIHSI